MSFTNSTPFGPYFVHNEIGQHTREAGGETFRIFISAAYNAMGLIGSEADGIVILNDTRKEVVVDQLHCSGSGYFGPHPWQVEALRKILAMPEDEFLRDVARATRFRGSHTIPAISEEGVV